MAPISEDGDVPASSSENSADVTPKAPPTTNTASTPSLAATTTSSALPTEAAPATLTRVSPTTAATEKIPTSRDEDWPEPTSVAP